MVSTENFYIIFKSNFVSVHSYYCQLDAVG